MESLYTGGLFEKKKKGGEETSDKSEELEGKGQGTTREGDYPLL